MPGESIRGHLQTQMLTVPVSVPSADGYFLRIVDVRTALPAVALAEPVVVHAILLLLLFLLLGLTNDG